MSLWDDFEADAAFAWDFPFGIPCNHWTMKDGTSIPLEEMTTSHIRNCMRLVGEDDAWYGRFQKELEGRGEGGAKT